MALTEEPTDTSEGGTPYCTGDEIDETGHPTSGIAQDSFKKPLAIILLNYSFILKGAKKKTQAELAEDLELSNTVVDSTDDPNIVSDEKEKQAILQEQMNRNKKSIANPPKKG